MSETNRNRIAERTIAGLKDLVDRLAIVGGRIEATGLRTTIVGPCPCQASAPNCPVCMGTGYVRKVIEQESN